MLFGKNFVAAAGLAITGLLMMPAAASAAAPWSTLAESDNYRWFFTRALDFYDSTDEGDTFNGQFYYSAVLRFGAPAGPGTESSSNWCTDPITPGTVTTVGADTVVTCAPYTIGVGQPGAGLTVTVEIRILHALDVLRLFYTVENSTGSDITVPTIATDITWENDAYFGVSSSGVTGDGTSAFVLGSEDTWVITADDTDVIPSAVIWAAADNPTFTVGGDSDYIFAEVGATSFGAGESQYYAHFLQMETPSAVSDVARQTAIDDLASSLTERYQSLSAALSVGMPPGVDVVGWRSGASPEPESLANTGPDDAVVAGSAVLAALFATLALIARKTRRQRS